MNERTILRAHRRGARVLISALTLASLSASVGRPMSAHAAVISPDAEIARCIARAAGGKDWLEKTLIGLRDQEGGWVGAEISNGNGSYDLGPLQINSWWVPKLAALLRQPERYVRHWLKNDTCFNAEAARWIFLTALRSTGDYWSAIGAYHSPTAWRQRRYAMGVADHLTQRFGRAIFVSPVRQSGSEPPNSASTPSKSDAAEQQAFGFGVVTMTRPAQCRIELDHHLCD